MDSEDNRNVLEEAQTKPLEQVRDIKFGTNVFHTLLLNTTKFQA